MREPPPDRARGGELKGMERAGLAPGSSPAVTLVRCRRPAAPEAGTWAAGWEGAGAFAAVGTDGLAVAGGTTAATGLGCADVEPGRRTDAPAGRACRPGRPSGRGGALGRGRDEEDAAGADESGTDATGRGVDRTVGAEGSRRRRRGRSGVLSVLPGRRLSHQLSDPLHGRRVETGQGTHLDVQPPFLDSLEQLLALQSQFFRQLVNTRGQRQLLPEPTPDGRGRPRPGA